MDAIYYDGQVARSRRVSLTIEADAFVVTGDGVERRDPAGAVQIMEAIGRTPRVVRFVGGASCEIHDLDGFDALLRAHDIDQDKVSVLDRSWTIVGAAMLFVVLVAAGGYRYGLPALARSMADRLPRSTLNTFSEHIQSVLDSTVFQPSELPAERQQTIRAEFNALRVPAGAAPSLQVSFRRADGVGANALTLPSGNIIVTDQLVELLKDDRQIIAVLAHEAGHAQHRHAMRQIIQGTVMGALVAWYIGDVSGLSAAAPTSLLKAKYSRDLEREADDYAAWMLTVNHMPVSLLVDALEAIDHQHAEHSNSGALSYLSSHPATAERIAALRAFGK